jgi:hypothetical protein
MGLENYSSWKRIVDFLNQSKAEELKSALDELDDKIREILKVKDAYIDDFIVETLVSRINELGYEDGAYFYVWFVFMRANFLRGGDTISNKRFKHFVEFIKDRNYYFDYFSNANLLPNFWGKNLEKWQYAGQVEKVLNEIREKYKSGKKFVLKIREIAETHDDPLSLYLNLLGLFKSFKGINNKIANAIIGEIGYELTLLKSREKDKIVDNLFKNDWLKRLFYASFFNVMIDTHVANFFKEKIGWKNVDQFAIFLLAKKCKNEEIIRMMLNRYFDWIPPNDKDLLLKEYYEFVASNMIEKMIWMVCFVKKHKKSKKHLNEISKLKFFELSEDIFL